jgi:hypothetical protein
MRRSEELVAPVRAHGSKSQMPAYPDRPKGEDYRELVEAEGKTQLGRQRKNGISRDALTWSMVWRLRERFSDRARRAAGRATAAEWR